MAFRVGILDLNLGFASSEPWISILGPRELERAVLRLKQEMNLLGRTVIPSDFHKPSHARIESVDRREGGKVREFIAESRKFRETSPGEAAGIASRRITVE